ncbi:MAG: hypothetical protein NTY51_09595 [Deltaproteobacteria bacterium]|nr:hypothetical protein [Deltaproteobacteria bacterium]
MLKCDSILRSPPHSPDENISTKISPCAKSILDLPDSEIAVVALVAIDQHDRQIESGSETVKKNAPETSISIVSIPGLPVLCVKHFKDRGAGYSLKGVLRSTHGSRAFHNGAFLFERGFTAAAPVALVLKRRCRIITEEWLVMTAVPDARELDRYMVNRIKKQWSKEEKRRFLEIFADFLAGLHGSGVFHTDLKTCNIIVSESHSLDHGVGHDLHCLDSISFSLLDYDDVRRFRKDVNGKMRAKNLAQLFLSSPSAIDLNDRLEFFDRYIKVSANIDCDKNGLMKMILKRIKGKSLLYVGPEGDISESWRCNANCCEKTRRTGDVR